MKKLLTVTLIMVFVLGLMGGVAVANGNPPNWDISGNWMLDFANDTENREFVDLEQDDDGSVSGYFWWINNDDEWEYGGTLEGNVSGNDLFLDYERDTGYAGEFDGTIDKYGMSGTFYSSTTNYEADWSTEGSPQLLYEARITGGGQILAESGEEHPGSGKDINYRISFGGGSYIVNDDYWFDGLEVTFHNVSNEAVKGGKFVGTLINDMNFNFATDGVANYQIAGEFNGEAGYWMMIRVQDSGEPGFEDNLRFELHEGNNKVYDSYASDDFPGQSSDHGEARNYLDRGNIQVEDLR